MNELFPSRKHLGSLDLGMRRSVAQRAIELAIEDSRTARTVQKTGDQSKCFLEIRLLKSIQTASAMVAPRTRFFVIAICAYCIHTHVVLILRGYLNIASRG
jgi:hypothetical protein